MRQPFRDEPEGVSWIIAYIFGSLSMILGGPTLVLLVSVVAGMTLSFWEDREELGISEPRDAGRYVA